MFGYALRHPKLPASNGIVNKAGLTPLTLACKLGNICTDILFFYCVLHNFYGTQFQIKIKSDTSKITCSGTGPCQEGPIPEQVTSLVTLAVEAFVIKIKSHSNEVRVVHLN